MTSPYQQFVTDPATERDGVVLDYGDYAVKIARAGGANAKFAKVLEAKQRPYKRQIQNETLEEDVARKLLAQTYAEAVILDWATRQPAADGESEGAFQWGVFPGPSGPLTFGRDNVVKVLLDLPDFFADIREQSTKMALFRKEEIEADAKN
ncbi:MAG: hypothetical protein AB7O45_00535 [Alphaproteobacteria bacterium]